MLEGKQNTSIESTVQTSGTAFQESGTESMSVAEIKAALKKGDNSFAYNYKGLVNWKRGNKTGAIEDFSRAVEADPSNLEAYRNRGAFSVRLWMENERNKTHDTSSESRFKTLDTAIKDLTKVAKNAETKETYRVGLLYRGIARFKKADKMYKNHLYMPTEKQNLMHDAISDFTGFIKEEKSNVAPYFFRGLARYATGEFKGAVDDFNIVQSRLQDNPNGQRTFKFAGSRIAKAYDHITKEEKRNQEPLGIVASIRNYMKLLRA